MTEEQLAEILRDIMPNVDRYLGRKVLTLAEKIRRLRAQLAEHHKKHAYEMANHGEIQRKQAEEIRYLKKVIQLELLNAQRIATGNRERADEAEAELADWHYQHQRVLADARPKDEQHCTCCGDLRLEIERLKAELCECGSDLKSGTEGHGSPCHFCGELCDSLAADPGKWPVALPTDPEEPGKIQWHHAGCVMAKLKEIWEALK